MRETAIVFKALSDETRLKMLALLLRHGELCVCDFTNVLKTTQSKASRHLRYLLHSGLLEDRREGVWVYYRLSNSLDKNRKAIVATVKAIFTGEFGSALEQKFRKWQGRKKKALDLCKLK